MAKYTTNRSNVVNTFLRSSTLETPQKTAPTAPFPLDSAAETPGALLNTEKRFCPHNRRSLRANSVGKASLPSQPLVPPCLSSTVVKQASRLGSRVRALQGYSEFFFFFLNLENG